MLIFPEEKDNELFLDIFLTDADIEYLKEGKMLNDEICEAVNCGKRIYVGLLNARFRPLIPESELEELEDE